MQILVNIRGHFCRFVFRGRINRYGFPIQWGNNFTRRLERSRRRNNLYSKLFKYLVKTRVQVRDKTRRIIYAVLKFIKTF